MKLDKAITLSIARSESNMSIGCYKSHAKSPLPLAIHQQPSIDRSTMGFDAHQALPFANRMDPFDVLFRDWKRLSLFVQSVQSGYAHVHREWRRVTPEPTALPNELFFRPFRHASSYGITVVVGKIETQPSTLCISAVQAGPRQVQPARLLHLRPATT